jgi:hypothetical protein
MEMGVDYSIDTRMHHHWGEGGNGGETFARGLRNCSAVFVE